MLPISNERRLRARVPTRGAVVLRSRGHEVHGRCVAISEDTLDVRCHLGFALLGMAGADVELELYRDGVAEIWRLTGHVRAVRAATHTLVIQYEAPDAALAGAISDHLAAAGDVTDAQLAARERDHDERARTSTADESAGARRQEPS